MTTKATRAQPPRFPTRPSPAHKCSAKHVASRSRKTFAAFGAARAFCAPAAKNSRQKRQFSFGTQAAMADAMMTAWIMAALGGGGLAVVNAIHCLTMCGPLAAASQAQHGDGAQLRYLAGRSVSYAALGSFAGGVGQALAQSSLARWTESALAWLLAAVLGYTALKLFGLARGPRLITLGRAPRRSPVGRVLARVAHDPLLLGAATALLPCAALYAALLGSAALGDGALGALFMLSFALVTSPALLGGAQLARLARLGVAGRRTLGAIVLAGAVLTALRPISLLRAEATGSCPLHAAQERR
jgi:sulfite exporter TauE/SafE